MNVTYRPAGEVRKIAERLITSYHEHLDGCRIDYVFRSKHSMDKGKPLAGKARKITGLNAHLAKGDDGFFVIEIAEDIWKTLTPEQQIALVDHELAHCFRDIDEDTGEWKLSILPHDLAEFADIVKRHGLWSADLTHFVKASEQLQLID